MSIWSGIAGALLGKKQEEKKKKKKKESANAARLQPRTIPNKKSQSYAEKLTKFMDAANTLNPQSGFGEAEAPQIGYQGSRAKDRREQAEMEKNRWVTRLINKDQSPKQIRRTAASHSGRPTGSEIKAYQDSRDAGHAKFQVSGQEKNAEAIYAAKHRALMPPVLVPKKLANGAKLKNYTKTGAVYSDGTHLNQLELYKLVYPKKK